MLLAPALETLVARLTNELGLRVDLGEPLPADGTRLCIEVHRLAPVADIARTTGRTIADSTTVLGWQLSLILYAEGGTLIDQLNAIEAAASHIDERPVVGGSNFRADLALDLAADWATGRGGPAVALRARVSAL